MTGTGTGPGLGTGPGPGPETLPGYRPTTNTKIDTKSGPASIPALGRTKEHRQVPSLAAFKLWLNCVKDVNCI